MREYRTKKNYFSKILFFILILFPHTSSSDINKELKEIKANIIFLRHSIAPGFGDPDFFNLNNCNTQRNLNEEGILQSKNIGIYFKSNNIRFSEVLSSEWCRCKDTVKEMDIGKWKTFSGLNSFFQGFSDKNEVLKKLNKKLSSTTNDELILMVTHQVVISSITGLAPLSGGIIIYNSQTRQSKEIKIQD
mgnify:CR=1 FL=1